MLVKMSNLDRNSTLDLVDSLQLVRDKQIGGISNLRVMRYTMMEMYVVWIFALRDFSHQIDATHRAIAVLSRPEWNLHGDLSDHSNDQRFGPRNADDFSHRGGRVVVVQRRGFADRQTQPHLRAVNSADVSD